MSVGLAIFLFWMICGVATAGFANAYLRAEYPINSARESRGNLGCSLAWGLFGGPFTLVLSFFLTGFWLDGWSFSITPDEQMENRS